MPKSYPAIAKPRPEALVIHCIDPRFAPAFREFIDGYLNLPPGASVVISIAGGPAVLAYGKRKPEDYLSFVKQLLFCFKHFKSLKRVIIIAHQDCGYYGELYEEERPKNREKEDLFAEAKAISDLPPGLKVEAWFARFTDENPARRIAFEQVQ